MVNSVNFVDVIIRLKLNKLIVKTPAIKMNETKDWNLLFKILTLINLGAEFPKQLLTVVIYKADLEKFKEPEKLYLNKKVCIKVSWCYTMINHRLW